MIMDMGIDGIASPYQQIVSRTIGNRRENYLFINLMRLSAKCDNKMKRTRIAGEIETV